MKALIATLSLTLVLVGCGSDESDTGKSAGTSAPNRQANSASTVPTANPTKSFAMGEKAPVLPGSTLQVYAYEQGFPAPTESKEKPKPGNVFAAVEMEACAEPTRSFVTYPSDYRLELPDGGTSNHRFTVKAPIFSMVAQDGRCSRGWLSFEVPENQRPAWFRFGSDHRWAIP